jgi:hypothetical protein
MIAKDSLEVKTQALYLRIFDHFLQVSCDATVAKEKARTL